VLLDERVEPLNQLLNGHLSLPGPEIQGLRPLSARLLPWARRDDQASDGLDDAVARKAVLEPDEGELVDSHYDKRSTAGKIHANGLVGQQRGQVDVMRARPLSSAIFGEELSSLSPVVIRCRIKRVVGDDVVLEQGTEILDSNFAEEESVDAGSEQFEGQIRRSKESPSHVFRGFERLMQARLLKAQQQSTESSGQMLQNE
jgi:hypothetical protein